MSTINTSLTILCSMLINLDIYLSSAGVKGLVREQRISESPDESHRAGITEKKPIRSPSPQPPTPPALTAGNQGRGTPPCWFYASQAAYISINEGWKDLQ
ncbi:unnamed protein product [Pleuronectes platessa]|uniref:Uncharacterized protein n=1 Tax=Pleuronectes platessa TaxID=8262 RepID=A0A9N7VIR8_PLEPL|nr:unnamed protein product [Pleuronectes platessa]